MNKFDWFFEFLDRLSDMLVYVFGALCFLLIFMFWATL